jgi:hypothetical protein
MLHRIRYSFAVDVAGVTPGEAPAVCGTGRPLDPPSPFHVYVPLLNTKPFCAAILSASAGPREPNAYGRGLTFCSSKACKTGVKIRHATSYAYTALDENEHKPFPILIECNRVRTSSSLRTNKL